MSAIVRLMWKEYRVLRSFWLALAIFGLAGDALIFALVANPLERLPGFYGFAGVLPAGFALGAGAILFALEREEATRDFLRTIPATSPRIFAGKVLTALLGTLLLALLLVTVSIGDARQVIASRAMEAGIFTGAVDAVLVYSVIVVQAMAWSVFFSLQSARPLLAALLGALGAVCCVAMVHVFQAEVFGRSDDASDRALLLLHLVAAAAVWSANGWLGSCWLHGRRTFERTRSAEVDRFSAPGRLLWQEWRRSRRLLAVLFALGVLVPLGMWGDRNMVGAGVIPAVGIVVALLGACTFLGDQERWQFRFFAERGVSPRMVWYGRLLFWSGAALALAAFLLFVHLLMVPAGVPNIVTTVGASHWTWPQFVLSWFGVDIGPPGTPPYEWRVRWLTGIAGYLLWVALAFGSGQVCSMFLRSSLLAAVCGVVLAALALGWAALMQVLAIGWWWSVAPLAAAMFVATRLRVDGWVLERHGWRWWLAPLTVLAAPVVVLFVGVPIYRVWEIPEPAVPLSAEAPAPASGAAKAAVQRLSAAFQMRPLPRHMAQPPIHPADAAPTADLARWLSENQAAPNRLIAVLNELPDDAAARDAPLSELAEWRSWAAMIVRYGQLAEREGQLDEAWRRYQAVFKLAHFVRRGSGVLAEIWGDEMEQSVAVQMIRWAAQDNQSPERLQTALDALRRAQGRLPPLADVVLADYRDLLGEVGAIEDHPEGYDRGAVFLARWAPWEFKRFRRLAAYTTSLNLVDARAVDVGISGASVPASHLPGEQELAAVGRLWQTTLFERLTNTELYAENRRSVVCYLRAAELAVAAEAWRLEHDALPEHLAELKGPYFEKLPLDPYTNQPFEWLPWGLRLAVPSSNTGVIPAGTPLVYSRGQGQWFVKEHARDTIERLRRRSADDPVETAPASPAAASAAGFPAPRPGAASLPAMGGTSTAPSSPGTANTAAPAPNEYLVGLAFPLAPLEGRDTIP